MFQNILWDIFCLFNCVDDCKSKISWDDCKSKISLNCEVKLITMLQLFKWIFCFIKCLTKCNRKNFLEKNLTITSEKIWVKIMIHHFLVYRFLNYWKYRVSQSVVQMQDNNFLNYYAMIAQTKILCKIC